jgi:hypothetical protein
VTADAGRHPPQLAVGVTGTRIRVLGPAAHGVHRVILRAFATTGRAADAVTLAGSVPAGHELGVLLGELHDRDVVRLDEHGGIRAAYPFSAIPTAHTVVIAGGPTVFAMCAIDALGIADMLGRAVTITSTDPGSGEPIRVSVADGQAVWEPDTAVVFDGVDTSSEGDGRPPSDSGECTVAAADRCCGVMNFFTSTASADAWLTAHPQVSGVILTKDQALREGVDIFGHLLDD